MQKKSHDDESALFRETVGDIQPLKSANKIKQAKKIRRTQTASLPLSACSEFFVPLSDSYTEVLAPEDTVYYRANETLSSQLIQKMQRGEYPLECIMDLHGDTIETAREKFLRVLHQAYQAQKRGVLLIHGKGQHAVLKNHVVHWLKQIPWVLFFCSAKPEEGGTGALYVLLKRKAAVMPSLTLHEVRAKIDVLDHAIVALLCERFAYAEKAAQLKKTTRIDSAREELILKQVSQQANQLGIPGDLIENVYQVVLKQMRKYQINATMAEK